jgi:Haem-binding domain
MFKKIILFLLACLIIIQFIHPKKNKADGPQPNYIGAKYAVPADVKTILVKACNDCHSNNTRYPWYAMLQPVHWWMTKHVNEGKREINFDEIAGKPVWLINKKMEEVIEQVKEGEMPLSSYTITHRDAKLAQDEKAKLTNWAQSVMDTIRSIYPADSLQLPKRK